MIFKHVSKLISNFKPEDIVQTKFQKPSLIDDAGKMLRNNEKEKIKQFNIIQLNLEELIKIIKK